MKKALLSLAVFIICMLMLSSCEEKHTAVIDEEIPPTCREEGKTQGAHCSDCGKILIEQISIPKLPHTEVTDAKVEPTCTEEGKTEGKHCSVCGEITLAREVISKLPHTEVTDAKVEPTCTEEGITEGKHCSVCGTVLIPQESLPITHKNLLSLPAVSATCTNEGKTEGIYCKDCGIIIVPQETVSLKDHQYDNNECTVCGATDFYWESVDFIYQMTNHSANGTFTSSCERYLSGEYNDIENDIDLMVRQRNENAAKHANAGNIDYVYYPDTSQYAWGHVAGIIIRDTYSVNTEGLPDMYVNYLYDMVAASLQGCFANLYGTTKGLGNNYFPFLEFRDAVDNGNFNEEEDGRGYMYEYMTKLSLSKYKMYLLASDYYIDIIRAFYVIPVNVSLLDSLNDKPGAEDLLSDLTGDGRYTVDDLCKEVYQKSWTYKRLAELSGLAYSDIENPGQKDLGDIIGFGISSQGALSSSGMLYSTDCPLIERKWNLDTKDYTHSYLSSNQKLLDIFSAINTLMGSSGVISVAGTSEEKQLAGGASTAAECIERRFTSDKMLFGGIVLTGNLERQAYQDMLFEDDGFGILPIPLYSENTNDPYVTQIHNEARIGAISSKSTKFEQCTAYLNYLSTHSENILEGYYKYIYLYGTLGGEIHNIYMMDLIRSNVRYSFDNVIEDKLHYYFFPDNDIRWHAYLYQNEFSVPDFPDIYPSMREHKQKYLDSLIEFYEQIP